MQQTDQAEKGMRELFSTHLGMSIPRTYYALCHILERSEGGWSNLLIDNIKVKKTSYIFLLKRLLASVLFYLKNNDFVTNDQADYITDNFYGSDEGFTNSEVDVMVREFINKNDSYLDELLSAEYSFNATKYGIEVSV